MTSLVATAHPGGLEEPDHSRVPRISENLLDFSLTSHTSSMGPREPGDSGLLMGHNDHVSEFAAHPHSIFPKKSFSQLYLQEFAWFLFSAALFHPMTPIWKLSCTPDLWPIIPTQRKLKNKNNFGNFTSRPPCWFFCFICASSSNNNDNN